MKARGRGDDTMTSTFITNFTNFAVSLPFGLAA
jgi:hypothetical protein